MTALGAIPWPDAPRPAAPLERAVPRPRRPSLAFCAAVVIVLIFSGGWIIFIVGPKGNAEVGSLVMALHTPAYLAAVWLLVRRWRRAALGMVSTPLLWALMALVALSVLWSINPDQTARRSIALLFTTLAGVALAATFDWEELSEVLAASFAVLILASIALAVLLPGWGRMTELFPGAWKGLWSDKNGLGGHMAKGFCLLMAAAVLNRRRRWWWAGFAGLAIFLILMSWSKTALVTALLGGGMLGFVALVRRGGAVSVIATAAGVLALAGLAYVGLFARDAAFAVLGKDATLTGRTAIWKAAAEEIAKRPMLGYGYQSVWNTEERWAPLGWIVKHAKFRAQHAHNGWIETALGLGRVGLVAWGAVFLEIWLRTIAAIYRSRGAWLALPFLTVYSVQSLTESTAYIYNDFTWVIFVALLVRLALPRPADDTAVDGGPAVGPPP